MAVTFLTYPATADRRTVSRPFRIELQTDIVLSTVEHHRFYLDVSLAGVGLGRKWSLAITGNTAWFDVAALVREAIRYSPLAANGVEVNRIADLRALETAYMKELQLTCGETYWDGSSFVENSGSTLSWDVFRSWQPAETWDEPTWYFYADGMPDALPRYSGYKKMVFPVPVDAPGWSDVGARQWAKVSYETNLGSETDFSQLIYRTSSDLVYYAPMMIPGETDQEAFQWLKIRFYTDTSVAMSAPLLEQEWTINRNLDVEGCPDEELLVMFLDRFRQWNFFSFTKKHFIRKTREGQQFRAAETGNELYDVRSTDTWRVNTDWLPEEQNGLVRDLTDSPVCFLIDADGYQQQCILTEQQVQFRTRRNNRVQIQYSFNLEFSTYNFRP